MPPHLTLCPSPIIPTERMDNQQTFRFCSCMHTVMLKLWPSKCHHMYVLPTVHQASLLVGVRLTSSLFLPGHFLVELFLHENSQCMLLLLVHYTLLLSQFDYN